jgi:hypothetical protein
MKKLFPYRVYQFVLWLSALGIAPTLSAQILGCTDPLASNYSASATQNDGSCTYANATITPLSSVALDGILVETSGLISWNSSLWTHNDNSDVHIYSIDTLSGGLLQTPSMTGTSNTDWEEISQDSSFIYLGDFGNNGNGNRTDLHILRIEKSSVLSGTPLIETIYFSYANQTDFTGTGANNTDFDCEAFIVSQDSIFLFTKQWVSTKTSVYSIPKLPGTYTAALRGTIDVQGLITGATYLAEKRLIALCGYTAVLQPFLFLLYDFSGTDFTSGNKRRLGLNLSFHQVEGIATNNGLKYYLSNEHFTQSIVDIPQKLHTIDLSAQLGNYLLDPQNAIEVASGQPFFFIHPNPAQGDVHFTSKTPPSRYQWINAQGKIVDQGSIMPHETSIGTQKLDSGNYLLKLQGAKGQIQTFQVIVR